MLNLLGFRYLRNLKYLFKFFLDKNNSFYDKLESLVYIILIISPLDLIPDYFAGFGFIDDLIILVIFLNRILVKLNKYSEEKNKNNDEGIEVEYKIKDDKDLEDE